MENEHIIIQLNNGSVSMDTKWIKALYNLGIASFGNCPSNGLLFSKSSLNLDRRISCRCVDSKHCSKICGICGVNIYILNILMYETVLLYVRVHLASHQPTHNHTKYQSASFNFLIKSTFLPAALIPLSLHNVLNAAYFIDS